MTSSTVYTVRLHHKIAQRPDLDTRPDLTLPNLPYTYTAKTLGRVLRRAGLLQPGQRLRTMRTEAAGRIVAFPQSSIWHSIVLTAKTNDSPLETLEEKEPMAHVILPRPDPLRFTVLGRPRPLERPRVERTTLPSGKLVHRTRTPGKSMAYRELVQLYANTARAAMPAATRWPYQSPYPVALSLRIFWEDESHGDGDNVFKALADAGNGILWEDDKLIVEGHFWSAVDRKAPRVEVLVEDRR